MDPVRLIEHQEERLVERLRRDGPNVVARPRPPAIAARVARQLTDPLVLLLLAALVVTLVVGDVTDAVIIALVVFANTTIGVVQEVRADRAISALDALAAPTARVVRDGRDETVPAAEVVRGDLVRLEAGSIVVASGVWSADLSGLNPPIPVYPRKGQILSLGMPPGAFRRMIRWGNSYFAPRSTGELVVGATNEDAGFDMSSTPAGLGRLHREAAHHQSIDEAMKRGRFAPGNGVRVAHPRMQSSLNRFPSGRVDRFHADRVGQNPICPGGDFCDKIGIAGGVHFGRRGRDDFQVGQDAARRRAVERLLRAVGRDRSAIRRVTVHRSGGRNHHVEPVQPMGG